MYVIIYINARVYLCPDCTFEYTLCIRLLMRCMYVCAHVYMCICVHACICIFAHFFVPFHETYMFRSEVSLEYTHTYFQTYIFIDSHISLYLGIKKYLFSSEVLWNTHIHTFTYTYFHFFVPRHKKYLFSSEVSIKNGVRRYSRRRVYCQELIFWHSKENWMSFSVYVCMYVMCECT